jgi:hypothetical protein
MTDTALPRLVRRSPIAVVLVVLLTFFVAAIEVPHTTPAVVVAPAVAA